MKLFLIASFISTLFMVPEAEAKLRFLPTPEGELALDLEIDLERAPQFSWATDPFLKIPGISRPVEIVSPDSFKLQAVTFQGDDPVAVVNDRVVRVGDRVSGRMVMKIGQDFVLLEQKGSILEASLYDAVPAPSGVPPSRGLASVPNMPGKKGSAQAEPEIRIEEVLK